MDEDVQIEESKPQLVIEVTVQAFNDGSINLAVPGDTVDLWVLRGVLAQALATAGAIKANA